MTFFLGLVPFLSLPPLSFGLPSATDTDSSRSGPSGKERAVHMWRLFLVQPTSRKPSGKFLQMFREVINLILTLLLFVGSVYLLQIFNLALWAREARSSVLTPGSVMLTEKAMLPLHVLTPQKKAADFVAVTKPNCPRLKICRHICSHNVVKHMLVKHALNVNFLIKKKMKTLKTVKYKSPNLTGLVFPKMVG